MFHIDSTELFVYVQLLQDTSHHFSSRVSPTGMVHAIKNASFFLIVYILRITSPAQLKNQSLAYGNFK